MLKKVEVVCNLCRKGGAGLRPYKQFLFHPECYTEYMRRTNRRRQ